MPDNLIVNVRQISQYPARNPVDGSDLVLLQAGGLGGPYYAATASAVFASIGITPGSPFVWGVGPAPPNAGPDQILAGGLSLPSNQAMLFNAYEATAGGDAYWSSGLAGSISMAPSGVFTWASAPGGAAGATITAWTPAMTLAPNGHLTLSDTLTVARDPTAALEVATMGYVTAHTVASWNGRTGAVTLTLADITGAGGAPIDSPTFTGIPAGPTAALNTNTAQLATTAFVVAEINSISPDVHSFNGRNGVVTFLTADFNAATAILTDPVPTAPTAATADSSQQLATTAFVHAALATAAVTSFNTRVGAVTLTAADLTAAGGALLASPAFTGTPNAPTANPGTSTGQLATTAFVMAAVAASTTGVASWNGRTGVVTLTQSDIVNAAGWASPSFTGTPLAPTAPTATNSTQIATTAFVHAAIAAAPAAVTSFNTRTGAVVLALSDVTAVGGAALASPAFTGTPTANTAVPGTNTTQLATTAFVAAALAAISTGVTSFNGRTGPVVLQGNDVSAAGGALINSPTFTGVPQAPTATTGDSSSQLATTAFVSEAIASGVAGVSTWNGRGGAVTMVVGDITAAGGAPVASPTFTGVPLAPTANAGTSTTQVATTAFVAASFAPLASPALTGTPTAPTAAVGNNTTQIATDAFVQSAVAPAFDNVGRNLLHNSLFNVAQRGAGNWTASGYTLDRWSLGLITDIATISQYAITDAQRAAIGDEAAVQSLTVNVAGNAAAGACTYMLQPIESLRRLSNKTVTVSFWAMANSGTPKLGVSIDQVFGTGGSPSANVIGNGVAVTVSTTPTRYSLTFTLPSISGKTIGTNNNDGTWLNFWYSAGSNFASRSGNIGVQTGVIQLWGVQLEVGTVATPLEKPDPQQDLAKCQRFYQFGSYRALLTANVAGSTISFSSLLPVPMRGGPAFTTTPGFASNVSAPTIRGDSNSVQVYGTSVATGATEMDGTFTASADL